MPEKIKVGVIGCGDIFGAYFSASQIFNNIEIIACSSKSMESAKLKAAEYNLKDMTVDELLADEKIKIILNLTTPQAHTEINLKALNAGKHIHCEKPLAVEKNDGKRVLELAKEKELLLGCAPDTFLGGGHQTCRKVIDDGLIGKPIAGTAFMMLHGHESWHPNPGFYYLKGGGPMLDMGPYYITALINLLGPVKRVSASASMAFNERIATSEKRFGERLPVETPTHIAGNLEFHNGAIITIITSFDVWYHSNHHIEIHGTEGSLQVPDPNYFDGPVKICQANNSSWEEVPLTFGYTDNVRSIGVADMARAIQQKSKNRCNGDLAYHVLEVMHAFFESSESGMHISIKSSCDRPDALPLDLFRGELVK
jgi:predicted dehydrogenase